MNSTLLTLSFLVLASCNSTSKDDPWVLKKDHHDQGVAHSKIYVSKLPHRGFDVVWQKNGEDEWILLETTSFAFEELDLVDVNVLTDLGEKHFVGTVRKGGQIIQLPPEAITFWYELQKENRSFLLQVGPLTEEISWSISDSLFDSPYLKAPF